MTVLIGWIGVDSHSPCSAYILSDSRLSWGTSPSAYNFGRKLFSLKNSPDILGYCGDALFSSQVLSQISEMDEYNLLFQDNLSSMERSDIVLKQINTQFAEYSLLARNVSSIYHISRDTDESFHAYKYTYDVANSGWIPQYLHIKAQESALIFWDGSGSDEFYRLFQKYNNGDISGTSRNIYQCFCDALAHTVIPSCGGAPQLVGLYRGKKFNGISFGIIYKGKCYFMGSPVSEQCVSNSIRWYNENFEICDGITKTRLPNAMRQPNPNI